MVILVKYLPSTLTLSTESPELEIFMCSSGPYTIALLKNECGHIGVTVIESRVCDIIGPPAESEYAVEPAGVEAITPSAR